uniref:C-type lectin domain-containing protein n=1 Tax=Poecilia mexicana TaxID=48701 RepID=A0A3B3YVF3_9TELE
MAAAEVTYADVKLPKSKVKADNRLLPEVTYSEVRRLRKLTEDSQPFDSTKTRKTQPRRQIKPRLTAERAALLVLSVLLAAAVIALSVTLTDASYRSPPTCPTCPAVQNETFLTCEAGWEPHGGNCYYFSTSKSSWTDSRRSCTDLGSDLVKIDSREEQTFLMRKVREKINGVNEIIWIGLTAVKTEGSWLWVNGSPLNTSFLGPNQPDCAG